MRVFDMPGRGNALAVKIFLLAANSDSGVADDRGALGSPDIDGSAYDVDGRLCLDVHALRGLLRDAVALLPELAPLAQAWLDLPLTVPDDDASTSAAEGTEGDGDEGGDPVIRLLREMDRVLAEHRVTGAQYRAAPKEELMRRSDEAMDRWVELRDELADMTPATLDGLRGMLDMLREDLRSEGRSGLVKLLRVGRMPAAMALADIAAMAPQIEILAEIIETEPGGYDGHGRLARSILAGARRLMARAGLAGVAILAGGAAAP